MERNQIINMDMDDVSGDFSGANNNALKRNPNTQYPQSKIIFFQKAKTDKRSNLGFSFIIRFVKN